MDKGHLIGMILLDLQKVFDTVDHSTLLMKLSAAGLGDDILRWFRSYLSDRQQLVDISCTYSTTASISCGVPQGSILGPPPCLIYVNDMPAEVKTSYYDTQMIQAFMFQVNVSLSLNKPLNKICVLLVNG